MLAAATLGMCPGLAARADDALPGDAIAPPANTNIFLYYNVFDNAGEIGAVHGDSYGKDTRISVDVQALRYIRTFDVEGLLAGVQVYEPYAAYLGGQHAGIANIAAPAGLPPGSPSYGPGRANLSYNSGFGQPEFGAFVFPVNNPQTGSYFVAGLWTAPPIGAYGKNQYLNYNQNLWMGEFEAGFHQTLFGAPDGQNLSLELWTEEYVFGSNSNAAYVSPAVSANAIPPIYTLYNEATGGLVPDSNPLRPQSAIPAKLSEQPSEELRAYFPYQFFPATRATFTPGLYQSFGGKQVYTLGNGEKLDSGSRTNETQLRFIVSTYLSPHWQVMLNGAYDVANHGGPLSREVEIRIGAAF